MDKLHNSCEECTDELDAIVKGEQIFLIYMMKIVAKNNNLIFIFTISFTISC